MATEATDLATFRARLPIVEIIGRYVKLRRRGRDYWGLCPFHDEKTASFKVDEERRFYHCFGCGAHGTAIDFVMAIEGLDFAAALQRIAELTGIPAPRKVPSATTVDGRLYEVNAAALKWFAEMLRGRTGQAARDYLARRKVPPDLIDEFELGYAPPGGDGLLRALRDRGFAPEILLQAGLVVRAETSERLYDCFRDRLMFPIHDGQGRVVGFGGRTLGEARPKYLNSPETDVFRKSDLLFNLHRARVPARRANELFVVEGYMDVVALAAIGIRQAVAPLGTAIGERQLKLAWQLCNEPLVCFDGDTAGRTAALRMAERALPLLEPGKSLAFVLLPEGEDPDSLVRRLGQAAAASLRQRPQPLVDLLWHGELERSPPTTPERRAALEKWIRERLREIADVGVRKQYAREWFGRLAALGPRPSERRGHREAGAARSDPARLEEALTGLERESAVRLLLPVLERPELLRECEERLAAIELPDPKYDEMKRAILDWYAETSCLDPLALRNHLSGHGFDGLIEGMRTDAGRPGPDTITPETWLSALEHLERVAAKRREAREIAEMSRNRETDAVAPRLADL